MVTVGGSGLTTFNADGSGWADFKFNGGLTINSEAPAKLAFGPGASQKPPLPASYPAPKK